MTREELLDRDDEIVRLIIEDDGRMSQEEYDALLDEKTLIEAILMRTTT